MAATCFSKAIVGLASQIASWQPALRGLYYSEWAVVLLFLCMDYQLLGRYTRSALNASQREHYGSVRIVGHYLAAVATLTVGALAMILQAYSVSSLATCVARLMGATSLTAATAAFCLARYTQGHEGFLLVGYSMFAVMWGWTAAHVLWQPTPHAVYVCWSISHTYALVRVFNMLLTRPTLITFKWTYTLGTTAGAISTIVITFDAKTAAALTVFMPASALILGRIAAKFHVRNCRRSAATRNLPAIFEAHMPGHPFQHYAQHFAKHSNRI